MALDTSAAEIEHEIDDACGTHALLRRPYSDAVFHLLTALDLERADDAGQLSAQQHSIKLGESISGMKHAMQWLAMHSGPADTAFEVFSADALRQASDLLHEAEAYLTINAAYSWARRKVIDLAACGHRLTMTFRQPNDDRYEAYDMLIKPTISRRTMRPTPSFNRLHEETERCWARNMVMGAVPTARNVLAAAYDICSRRSEADYQLPPGWSFGQFTIGDFRKVNDAVRAVVLGWLFTTDLAASYDSSRTRNLPFKVKRRELIEAVKDVTGLSKSVVKDIVSALTYSRTYTRFADPALQPLLAVADNEVILSAQLVLGGSPERNLVALINTKSAERALYDRLKDEKEALMRARLETGKPSYCQSWHGKVPGRKNIPNIDYALYDDRTGTVIVMELKWFVAPDETRELAERSEEIQKGVTQCKRLMTAIEQDLSILKSFREVKDVICIVVSANSIGMSYVQDQDVPVLNEAHFLEELAVASDLREVAAWLRARSYLPERGYHYASVEPVVRFLSWELEWYGFVPLQNELFLPLSAHGPAPH